MNGNLTAAKPKRFNGAFALLLLLLGGTLAVLCHEGFRPYEIFWANDQTFGTLMENSSKLPGAFFACWDDYFWIGGPSIVALSLSNICLAVFSPEHYLKFYAPGSMLFLGCAAWFFFRQLRFAPMVCVVCALGAGLNMHFFSNACWGLGQWNVCCGMILVALAVLVSTEIRPLWLKAVLAGLATGMAVMEGFDVGAILSIYVAVFLAFLSLTGEGPASHRAGRTLWTGVLVVLFAFLISLSTIYTLVETQIKGTGQTTPKQTEAQKRAQWEFTTQRSIPKLETLRVIIPGLFGYRMLEFTTSTNKAGVYWGSVAEDPHIQELESGSPLVRSNALAALGIQPQADVQAVFAGNNMALRQSILEQVEAQLQRRHTGNGEYAGVLVCLLAVFGLASAARKAGSPYSAGERRAVWFWAAAALFSLLAAWGRYGFIYRFIYQLPLLASIRNPMKFMHPMNLCLIILSGYGLETLYRGYLSQPVRRPGSLSRLWSEWWKRASGFETRWVIGSAIAFVAAIAGYFIMQSSRPDIVQHLQHSGFDGSLAMQIARFCAGEVGLFVIYLGLSAGILIVILTGAWAGKRAVLAWVFLCAVMICDLSRADAPWIRYYNYKEKMSMNPIVDILRQKPWEHRVVSRLSPQGPYDIVTDSNFGALCHWWLENDYPYNNIESLEIDQAPRMPVLDSRYLGNFVARSLEDDSPAAQQWLAAHQADGNPGNPNSLLYNWVLQSGPAPRLWRLTNTRYILADARLTDVLNQFSGLSNSFRTVLRVNMVAKPGVELIEDGGDMTVQTNNQGSTALIEFANALPRAKLYGHWEAMEDDSALRRLDSAQFDPQDTVLVARQTPVAQAPGQPGVDVGTVDISQYDPKDLILKADAKIPAVLLLNDRTGDDWNVWIDQNPSTILRCNVIMQGVFVPPGRHTIEFRYQPPRKMLFVSLAAYALGILLGGYVFVAHFVRRP